MSAYAFFVHTCRQELKNSSPSQEVVFGEFSKRCAAKWKVLDPIHKRPFEEMAERDKIRWQNEMELLGQYGNIQTENQEPEWKSQPQQLVQQPHRPKKQIKDPNAPRRPHSAFLLYCADHRAIVRRQYPGLMMGQIAKKLGEGWAQCPADLKKQYEAASQNEKEDYRRQKEIYKANIQNNPPPNIQRQWDNTQQQYNNHTLVNKPRKRQKQKKDPNAPKRPHSAFLLYCADHRGILRQQFPGARVGELAKKLGAGWAQCDPEVREQYEAVSTRQKEEYKRQKELYQQNYQNQN